MFKAASFFKPVLFAMAFVASFGAGAARADVTLGKLFSDNMMVQRNRPIRVWGKAAPGEAVVVTLAGKTAETKADGKGAWIVELPPLAEGNNLELAVTAANKLLLKNVIVGDIWLCSGQSNMEWTLAQCDGAEDAKAADLPMIRRVKFAHQVATAAADEPPAGPWQVCTPQTAGEFTAAGFHFARELQARTGVPIGLLDDNWGGTAIEPWVAPEGIASVAELAKDAEARKQAIENWRTQALPRYLDDVDRWLVRARAESAAGGLLAAGPPAMPANPAAGGWSSIYNAMIHPIVRFPIKGVIWYQGESNGAEGESYFHKMRALVEGWRKVWDQPEMPFYFVQLASYQKPTDAPAGGDGWAKLREAQRKALEIPRTGMVVAIDTVPLAVAGDIHPKNKVDLGMRLARWALHRDYGKADLVPSGPLFKGLKVEGDKVRLEFDHVGSGLMVGLKDGTRKPVVEEPTGKLKRFAIAGADKKWVWADAAIDGRTVVVSSPEVKEPVAVRYAFSMNPDGANLFNREGLPASPFRTDDW
jgi:sialate O-acetylesterase